MPGMDGFEVCRRIRADEKLAEVPVIMITSLDDKESCLEGIEAGADEFISKPFDKIELRARVKTVTRLNRFRNMLSERSKFQSVIETAPDGIMVVGLDMTIALANPAVRRMLKVADERALEAETADTFLPQNRVREFRQFVAKVQEQPGAVGILESELAPFDGSPFPVEISAGPFPLDDQLAVQLNVRDVTEKRLLEAKFLRAQRLESIGALAGGITHDLNNVLSPILISAGMIKRFPDDERRSRWINTLETCATRGKAIIKQILSYARGAEDSRAPLSVCNVTREVRKLIEDTFPASIEIRVETAEDLYRVRGNYSQLHQVLMNLCVNARDAMPDGGLLTISVENARIQEGDVPDGPAAKPGEYVVLSVSDTGVGMSEETRAQIFDPFFTTKDLDRGTGLGLATVMSIVDGHNGFLSVESEQGIGSTFKACLPACLPASRERTRKSRQMKLRCRTGRVN